MTLSPSPIPYGGDALSLPDLRIYTMGLAIDDVPGGGPTRPTATGLGGIGQPNPLGGTFGSGGMVAGTEYPVPWAKEGEFQPSPGTVPVTFNPSTGLVTVTAPFVGYVIGHTDWNAPIGGINSWREIFHRINGVSVTGLTQPKKTWDGYGSAHSGPMKFLAGDVIGSFATNNCAGDTDDDGRGDRCLQDYMTTLLGVVRIDRVDPADFARYGLASTFTIPNPNVATQVPWTGAPDEENGNHHTVIVGNDISCLVPGPYEIFTGCNFNTLAGDKHRNFVTVIRHADTTETVIAMRSFGNDSNSATGSARSGVVNLIAGDVIRTYARSDSANTPRNLVDNRRTYCTVAYLGNAKNLAYSRYLIAGNVSGVGGGNPDDFDVLLTEAGKETFGGPPLAPVSGGDTVTTAPGWWQATMNNEWDATITALNMRVLRCNATPYGALAICESGDHSREGYASGAVGYRYLPAGTPISLSCSSQDNSTTHTLLATRGSFLTLRFLGPFG